LICAIYIKFITLPSHSYHTIDAMPQNSAIQSLYIVIPGQFSPAIFHPAWFAAQDLILHREAEAAEIQLIHPDAAIFQIDWCSFHVVRNRFQVGTSQEPYFEPLRDLVSGVFSLLNHTPVTAMGINWRFRSRLASEKTWHAVGHRLAPKDDWNDVLDSPGTLSLVIEGKRPDKRSGHIRVTVQPSQEIDFGISIEINDHYELSSNSSALSSTNTLIDILSENWNASMQRAQMIFEKIARLGDTL
jgi:hypothetical protein